MITGDFIAGNIYGSANACDSSKTHVNLIFMTTMLSESLLLYTHLPLIDNSMFFYGAIDNSLTLPLDIRSKHFQDSKSFQIRWRYWGNWHNIHMSVASDVKNRWLWACEFSEIIILHQTPFSCWLVFCISKKRKCLLADFHT